MHSQGRAVGSLKIGGRGASSKLVGVICPHGPGMAPLAPTGVTLQQLKSKFT